MDKSEQGSEGSFFENLKSLLGLNKGKAVGANLDVAGATQSSIPLSCCSDRVHIAYRGVSDDRLYLAENRTTNEVKFFRPNGLRVFCAVCRKRLF